MTGFRKVNQKVKWHTDAETGERIGGAYIENTVDHEQRDKLPIQPPFIMITQRDTADEKWLKLTPIAFKLLILLGRLLGCDGKNHVDYTTKELVERFVACPGLSHNSIDRGMRELRQAGFLAKHPRRGYVLNEKEIYKRPTTRKR